jgi:2-haloacid dehalogenase
MTPAMLQAGIRNSQLDGVFDHVLSTDAVKAYKPDPRAYPTFWVNRQNQPVEELGVIADGIGATLTDLTTFLTNAR